LYKEAYSAAQQRELDAYRRTFTCNVCNGKRLTKESLAVRINEQNINDIVNLDIEQCLEFFKEFPATLNTNERIIADLISKEICNRLQFLLDVGLPYFSLNRPIITLSGGEAQRIRLASQIGSQLVGITYVLDEPSIGLHQHNKPKLI
jgi:excinuclease ABC subunit A